MCYGDAMAKKTTKGKATKRTQATRANRRTAKVAKKPRKAEPATSSAVESTGLIDRLRAWSPSRYLTRR